MSNVDALATFFNTFEIKHMKETEMFKDTIFGRIKENNRRLQSKVIELDKKLNSFITIGSVIIIIIISIVYMWYIGSLRGPGSFNQYAHTPQQPLVYPPYRAY